MNENIKNIIFDFGGVLVDLSKERTVEAFRALGFDAGTFIGTYGQGGPFASLEKGESTPEAFYAEIARLSTPFGTSPVAGVLTPERIRAAWNLMLVGIPPRRLQALLRLRRRYRLFLLSNTNRIHWELSEKGSAYFAWQGHRPEDFFEHIFLSCDLHLLKPGEAIFRRVLNEAGLCPSETLFIDDSAENCAAAARLGLSVFCPKEADDWMPLFL